MGTNRVVELVSRRMMRPYVLGVFQWLADVTCAVTQYSSEVYYPLRNDANVTSPSGRLVTKFGVVQGGNRESGCVLWRRTIGYRAPASEGITGLKQFTGDIEGCLLPEFRTVTI